MEEISILEKLYGIRKQKKLSMTSVIKRALLIFRSYIIVCETVYFQANMLFSVKMEGINYKYRAIRKYDTSEIDHDFTKYGIHIL